MEPELVRAPALTRTSGGPEHDHRTTVNDLITRFLEGGPFAVVGASADRAKFGNKVLRRLMDDGRTVSPVHPKAD